MFKYEAADRTTQARTRKRTIYLSLPSAPMHLFTPIFALFFAAFASSLSAEANLFGYASCTINSDTTCDLKAFDAGTSTIVYPKGETRCIYSHSGDFGFQVWPGSSSKLMIYFQGGGACWTKDTSIPVPTCTTSCTPQIELGVFDKNNAENPFADYTIVHIMYCSGDAHAGLSTRDYNDWSGAAIEQRGATNVFATLDWIIAQKSFFSTGIDELIVAGASAGSLGAQVWADQVISKLEATIGVRRSAVLADSYAGVFPDGSQGPTMQDFGICDSGVLDLSPDLVEKCEQGVLTLQDIAGRAMERHPDVPFAFIQSKRDIVQKAYYDLIDLTEERTVTAITDRDFFAGFNSIFEDYVKIHDNVLFYIVDSAEHTYTELNLLYHATASGAFGGGTGVTLVEWLGRFPMQQNETLASECEGDRVNSVDERPEYGTSYCDGKLDNAYIQH